MAGMERMGIWAEKSAVSVGDVFSFADVEKTFRLNGVRRLYAPKGTEMQAAASGEVIVTESAPKTHGNYILLQHENNFETFYSHCDSPLVQAGQQMKAGELIARVGNKGRATGSHLHFEIREDDKPDDPKRFIDFKNLEKAK